MPATRFGSVRHDQLEVMGRAVEDERTSVRGPTTDAVHARRTGVASLLARLLREPLLHFFVLGGVILGVHLAVARPGPPPAEIISIGPERLKQLRAGFESAWQRPPTEDEMSGLTADFVRGEIYYREAMALGLDRDDVVVRNRLRQKMEFLTDSGSDSRSPTDAELKAWLAANPDSYRREPQLAFDQVFLGADPAPTDVARLLDSLRTEAGTDFASMGERTLLPGQVVLSRPRAIDNIFGKGFFGPLQALPHGVWSGPIASTYGFHLVRITDGTTGGTPTLEEFREAAARDWSAARAAEERKSIFARLRSRYVVEINGVSAPEVARQ